MSPLRARCASILFLFLGIGLVAGSNPSRAFAEPVPITFRVVVSTEVPPDDALYWTGTLNRWDPGPEGIGQHPWAEEEPLSQASGDWSITLDVPRGDTVRYRYTRGSVFSVEGAPKGGPHPAREVVADRPKTVVDTVTTWRDRPDSSKAGSWFRVALETANPDKMRRNGEAHRFRGTTLYATDRVREFFRGYKLKTHLKQVPEALTDTLVYPRRMSNAPRRNTVRFLAGQRGEKDTWRIYADADNDGRVRESDLVFQIPPNASEARDTLVTLEYDVARRDSLHTRIIDAKLRFRPDPPSPYASTHTDAPTLILQPEFAFREGTVQMRDTTMTVAVRRIHAGHGLGWRGWHSMLIDQDGDGTYDVSKGSNERFEFQDPFRLGYLDLEVADIDPYGEWIRLRPATDAPPNRSMQPGDSVVSWTHSIFEALPPEAGQLQDRYVLLDFWASWCAPCIEALPTLQTAYRRFSDTPFVLLGIAVNDRRSNVERVVERRGLDWPQVYDGKALKKHFRVRGLPDPILIGPDGVILERGSSLRENQLLETLGDYLETNGGTRAN